MTVENVYYSELLVNRTAQTFNRTGVGAAELVEQRLKLKVVFGRSSFR